MKSISSSIADGKNRFVQHPFLLYLNDEGIPLEKRLTFLPDIAHFVMTFSDINRYILPFPQPQNFLEEAINTHAREDATHWPWYLRICIIRARIRLKVLLNILNISGQISARVAGG